MEMKVRVNGRTPSVSRCFKLFKQFKPPRFRQELRKTRSSLDFERLLHKEPVDDRIMPKLRYRRNNAHGKFFVGPTPGVNAGAEGDAANSRSRIELGKERQRSLATFQRYRIVVDAVNRQEVRHRLDTLSRQ